MPRRVDIQITIFISYFGSKASQVNSSDFSTAYKILKADLLVLKVCYPKRENVEVTPGCVKFFWTTRINSVSTSFTVDVRTGRQLLHNSPSSRSTRP